MIRIILATISVFCFTQSVSAQSNGPLGFTWGGGSNQLEAIEQIDLSREYSSFSEPDKYFCKYETIAEERLAPDSWKLDYKYYVNNSGGISRNHAKADQSIDGRLTAYLYNIVIFDAPMKACGIFIDDQLYSITIENTQISKNDGLRSLIKDALSQNYGPEKTVCSRTGTPICFSQWISNERKIFLDWGTVDGLTYFYAPLKAQQMEAWAEYYVNFVKSATAGSDL
jgi:hypothetical protein